MNVKKKTREVLPADRAPAAIPNSKAASTAHLAPSSPAISVPTATATSITAASIIWIEKAWAAAEAAMLPLSSPASSPKMMKKFLGFCLFICHWFLF